MRGGPETAMIMAAGFGTRMGVLTKDRPKPLVEVAGRSLIDHTLDRCEAAGVSKAVVNLHYRGDQMRAHLADRAMPEIQFSEEETILETGGGVKLALPLLGETPFFTVNADAIWTGPEPIAALPEAWRPEEMDALLLLVHRESAIAHSGKGDFFMEGGRLARRGDAAQAPFVYTGAQIIKPEAFADAPEGAFSTNIIWDRLLSAGRLFGVVHQGGWVDVGTPAGLAAANEAVAA